MLKTFQKIISEVFGHFLFLDEFSNRYAKDVMNFILVKSNNGKTKINPLANDLSIYKSFIETNRKYKTITSKWNLTFNIFLNNNIKKEINYVTGGLQAEAIKQSYHEGNFNYPVIIDVHIINWDYKTDLTDKIEEVLSHEMFHAFEYIKTFNKNDYTIALTKARKESNLISYTEGKEELKSFMEIFYLSLPNEISARIHEAYVQMKNMKMNLQKIDHNYVLKELDKLSVFRDFLKIQNFNELCIVDIPKEVKQSFVRNFNNRLRVYKNKLKLNDIKIIDEPDDFFMYWIGRAKKLGLEARHKIVAQAINIFSKKEKVSEYNNKKYKDGYIKQLVEEIFSVINSESSNIIYRFALDNTGTYDEDCLIEEVNKFSNFNLL